jgi:beta-RFAP synthase
LSSVFVDAPARLHLGLIDLRGDLGRKFGGIGATLESPTLLLEARAAPDVKAEGEASDVVARHAREFLARNRISDGVHLTVHRAIPAHVGLGSGTQIALATARALALLFGRDGRPAELALAAGRGQRSAIGTWAFEGGGFLLEGGLKPGAAEVAPLLLRSAMPPSWSCLVAIPDAPRGLSGPAEDEAFQALGAPPADLAKEIAHWILMGVLPALQEEDLAGFGRAVTEVQRLVGEAFVPVQGGLYAHPKVGALVEELLRLGAAGAGQSSWGPAVFGLFPGEAHARRAAEALPEDLRRVVTGFRNSGARCWAGSSPEPPA